MSQEKIALAKWLRDGGEDEAANILEQCELDYIFENIYFQIGGGEREYVSYDVHIKTLRKILREVKSSTAPYVEQIETAIRDFAEGTHIIQSISWIPATTISDDTVSESLISVSLAQVDSEHIHKVWKVALSRKSNDPDGAITASRTLIESVCKYILDKKKVSYKKAFDLPKLFSLTIDSLNLSPSQHPEKLIKQVLGNCQAVAGGIAALRNELGDAHGKGTNDLKPLPAYAELSVNLAGSIALFLVSIWENEKTATQV